MELTYSFVVRVFDVIHYCPLNSPVPFTHTDADEVSLC